MPQLQDVDCGWAWVVMMSTFMAQFTLGVLIYSQGVIQIILLDVFDGGILMTTWILGIFHSLISLAGPLAGLLINLTSCRTTMLIGSGLMFIGYTASAFIGELYHLYITVSMLVGLGQGLVYSPCFVVLGFYFERNFNLAVAVAVTGAGVGMMVGSPLVLCIEQAFGWRGMFLILAGIVGNCFVWSLLCRSNTVERAYMSKRNDNRKSCKGICANIKAVCSMPVILFGGSVFMWNITTCIVTLHLPNYLVVHGLTIAQSALLITPMGLCNIFARLLAGTTTNTRFMDQFLLYTSSIAVMAFITLGFPFLPVTFTLCMIYAGLFGLSFGGPYVAIAPIIKKLVGLQQLALAFGMQMMISGIGCMVGPPVAGGLFVISGSYTWSFVFAGLSCAVCSLLGGLLMKHRGKSPPEEIEMCTAETGKMTEDCAL